MAIIGTGVELFQEQYDDSDYEYAQVRCPSCHDTQDYHVARIGTLGNHDHLRCRYCGCLWSREI